MAEGISVGIEARVLGYGESERRKANEFSPLTALLS
jgi:hypothetical protein